MLYIVAVTVLFPGSLLSLAAGAIFGLPLGSLLVWLGTVLGQTLAFIIGRSLLLLELFVLLCHTWKLNDMLVRILQMNVCAV